MTGLELVELVADFVSGAVLIAGTVFVLAGAVGMNRLPEFYSRMHAAGVTDTLGAELIIFGLIIQAGFSLLSAKLLLLGLFVFLTSPTATHAVANAAFKAGLKPMLTRFNPKPGGGGSEE